MTVEIAGVEKHFGSFSALRGVSLTAGDGEFLALLGPSGSGKTTLLRIIAGLERPDAGEIRFGGENIAERKVRERNVGFVFQHYALFRHMTVFENVAFGLRVKPRARRLPEADIRDRVMLLLDLVQIEPLADRYPAQLSGGQRQRVALARALAIEPEVLLLDEPFGALDAKVRRELRRWLRHLHTEMGLTSIFVTHDQEEALELADRVVVLNEGRIEQIGPGSEIYENPETPFVFDFIGYSARFDARIRDGVVWIGDYAVDMRDSFGLANCPALAYVRPHDLIVDAAGERGIPAVVRHIYAAGPAIRVELALDDHTNTIEAEIPAQLAAGKHLSAGLQVRLRLHRLRVFPQDSGGGASPLRPATGGTLSPFSGKRSAVSA